MPSFLRLLRSTFSKAVILLLFILCTSQFKTVAQAPPKTSKQLAAPKPLVIPYDSTKKIVLNIRFGPYSAERDVFLSGIIRFLNTDLLVTDSFGVNWKVVYFRLGWRKKEVVNDVKTGKRKVIPTFNATEVDGSSKIPEVWQEEIKTNLKVDDLLMFESVVVQNPYNKKQMLAPSLLLKITGK